MASPSEKLADALETLHDLQKGDSVAVHGWVLHNKQAEPNAVSAEMVAATVVVTVELIMN